MSFMLERMGRDCAPLQFLRELTQNSIEAIQKTSKGTGTILWDVEWNYYELNYVYKLSIIDNGVGMTGEEMVRYINHLSASSGSQSMSNNYGIGAKISAGVRNPAGMMYLSWKDGVGHQIHFWKDPQTGTYGLRQFERPNGTYGHWSTIDDSLKPDLIDTHGTMVVLLGRSTEDNTMEAPEGARAQSRWIARYLNSRYAELPKGVEIRAREGWVEPRSNSDVNLTRKVTGQIPYLEKHKDTSGTVVLNKAVAHWWVLKDENALSQNSGYIESSGHIAALYQNELYELRSGRAGTAMLQQFGVIFGARRVVIYVAPQIDQLDITTNTSRTALVIDGEPAQWAEWAHEFRERMPQAIKDHMDRVAANSQSQDHGESIQNRLKQIEELFQLSRYRPTPKGQHTVDPRPLSPGGVTRTAEVQRTLTTSSRSRGTGGSAGALYALFQVPEGVAASEVGKHPYPEVKWVSIEDGTRDPEDMEDRAAKYLKDQHRLLVNADFRVFVDMVKRWESQFATVAGAKATVREVVREWFEQTLVEAVMGSFSLRGSREWSNQDVDHLLSPEALTAVILPRYHIDINIGRSLGTKLGSRKQRGVGGEAAA